MKPTYMERVKFIFSEMGQWLWPFIRQFLTAMGPVVAASATQAVAIVAEYGLTNSDDKSREAFRLIEADLKRQGKVVGVHVATSMVNGAIEIAFKNMMAK